MDFFVSGSYPRRLSKLSKEIQQGLRQLGLLSAPQTLAVAGLDFKNLNANVATVNTPAKPRFDQQQVARVVSKKQKLGTLDDSGLFSFEVFFKPNQSQFSESLYEEAFKKAIDLASTYGGAILTVEGHSDPLGFLRKAKSGESQVILKRVRQAAKNLSLSRANAVRDSIVSYAEGKGITLDRSQFAVIGHGIDKPATGICGKKPCAPKNEQEWLSNMRVEFRLIQVEAETSVFKPL